MAVRCGQCAQLVVATAEQRLPPWCPRCGGDLGKEEREERTASQTAPGQEESLADVIERITRSQEAQTREGRRNRRAGSAACLAGSIVLALGLFLTWFAASGDDGGKVVVPIGVLLVGLALTLAGIHAKLTGQDALGMNSDCVTNHMEAHREQPPSDKVNWL